MVGSSTVTNVPLQWEMIVGESVCGGEQGVYVNSLYFLLKVPVNLKVL